VDAARAATFEELITRQAAIPQDEYKVTDPGLEVLLEPADVPASLLTQDFQKTLLRAVYVCPNGVARMSPDIPGLVQTSNSLARVLAAKGHFEIHSLVRSAVDTEKLDLARALRCALEPLGAPVEFMGTYPGWTPRPDAAIVKLMSGLYRELFGSDAAVLACHAGLECGIIGAHYPEMQMISFGPNIRGAHSPDEKVQISSVQKFWTFLTAALARMPQA
jgi:dipeptidase D